MAVHRLMPSEEAGELIELVRDIARTKLLPEADAAEAQARFPREAFELLGRSGLLSLPYAEELGGGGQPYEVYLQVVEEIAYAWMSVAVGVSVHSLTCAPLAHFGTPEQQEKYLTGMLSGDQLGAYCLSEPQAGSDVASIRTRATPTDDGYQITGGKSWISHAGHADFYTTFARTSDEGGRGLSCFLVPPDADGLTFAEPERKMGLDCDTVREVLFDKVPVEQDRLIGREGQGMQIALAALDAGRLGIAAAATGLAQRALEEATAYSKEREQFGRPIADNQGLAFLLADMAAAVGAARSTYLLAARLKDAGLPHSQEASVAKLVATDAAMRVTTDAVQVLGGYGYTKDFPLERFMREAKVTQIFEGTNQIQRLVISRHLLKD
ncbi:acyl-CoA dehydrogenase family protein [Ornithinicoccus hortensis]|uniref:Alkylation response protein AidB-like acyl-CoA dehydrogenase n=1 Tax=Ornithinicoccus hortensis TaxID=82346 RepID=A0A542YPL1_9MICO|nr:acyl-CoA dehydrogenase family protein [Ornithinicoccus hortensis]TQL49864.1 alkylation response protein AidB-like acyl-CoA dehydrogenase [Ornithinicoccus hortensis]